MTELLDIEKRIGEAKSFFDEAFTSYERQIIDEYAKDYAALHYSQIIEEKEREIADDKQNIETLNEIMVNQADEISKLQSQIKILVEGLQKIKMYSGSYNGDMESVFSKEGLIAANTLTNYYNSTKQPSDNG